MVLGIELKFVVVGYFVVLKYFLQGVCQPQIPDIKIVNELNEKLTKRVTEWGFVLETHEVFTEDGYGLKIHRVLKKGSKKLSPLLIMHGIKSCGGVILAQRMSLAYYMAERDFDVWVGNARGTDFSLKHKFLEPKQRKFWDYSFHEIGYQDIPAFIRKVKEMTGAERVHYVGYSMGATAFLVMASTRSSTLRDEVASVTLVMPVALPTHHKDMKGKLNRTMLKVALKLYGFFSKGVIYTFNKNLAMAKYKICKTKLLGSLCEKYYRSKSVGKDMYDYVNTVETFPFFPCGASTKSFLHYIQMAEAKKFQYYDYGKKRNQLVYNQPDPIEYDLRAIDKEIIILVGGQDDIADKEDVRLLHKQLSNSFYITENLENFDHRDFGFSTEIHIPNKMILEVIEAYNDKRKPNLPLLKD